jgi:hypothetical protein
MAISNKVRDRLVTGLKRLLPVVAQQKTRDVSEADTVTVVKDLLCEVFGYDKYAELTSEHCIRGTFCDLAIKVDDKLVQLVEVKAVGIALDDRHVKQVVDYAANQGVEWVVLTNGWVWRIYHVIFAKPIDKRLLAEVDLTSIDTRKNDHLELLYLFTKEGFGKGAHVELRDRQDATNRYMLAALLLHNESVKGVIRRELRRMVGVLVTDDEVRRALQEEVLKRETLEGPDAERAAKRVNRTESRTSRGARDGPPPSSTEAEAIASPTHAEKKPDGKPRPASRTADTLQAGNTPPPGV